MTCVVWPCWGCPEPWLCANFVPTTWFLAQVQIDPYLEDSMCQVCSAQPGPFFCRDQVMRSPVPFLLLAALCRDFLGEEQAPFLVAAVFGVPCCPSSPAGEDKVLKQELWRRQSSPAAHWGGGSLPLLS